MPRERKLPTGMWKRGDTYYCRFRANGQLVRKRLSTDFRAASEMLNEIKSRADKGKLDLLDNSYAWTDLKRLFLAWTRQTKKPSTLAQYELDIRLFEAFQRITNVDQVTTEHMIRYRDWRLAGGGNPRKMEVCRRTVNKNVGTVRLMLAMAAQSPEKGGFGLTQCNPIAGLRRLSHTILRKERRAMEWSEVESVFRSSPAYLRPVWMMLGATGIRRGELIAMKFSWIDFEAQTVQIPAHVAKNKKARAVHLRPEIATMLKQLLDSAPGRTSNHQTKLGRLSYDHVFVGRGGVPWTKNPGNLLRAFYRVCHQAGIPGAEPGGSIDVHSWRGTFITLALDRGANLKAVSEMVGHGSTRITEAVYNKVTERMRKETVGVLPNFDTGASVLRLSEHTARTTAGTATEPPSAATG